MKTVLLQSPEEAAVLIRAGALVAFPTETVYGLGADALSEAAVRKIYAAKDRPADNPLIVHLAHPHQISGVAERVPEHARLLLDRFVPGPLTLILPRHPNVPAVVSAGLPTVGVRIPRHPVARAFLAACDRPVAAPSANRSGRPSSTTWQAVRDDLDGRIAGILKGEPTEAGLESTVVDCTGSAPTVLRAGVTTLEDLRAVLPAITMADSGSANDPDAPAPSPGTRHRHYAPTAQVQLIEHPDAIEPMNRTAYIGLDQPRHPDQFVLTAVCDDVATYARRVFDFFRRCDKAGVTVIYGQRVTPTGIGRALQDRLQRAAQD